MLKFIAQKIIYEQLGQVSSREHVRLRNTALSCLQSAEPEQYSVLEPRITYSTVLVSLRSTSPPLDGTGGRSALIRFALACFRLRLTQTTQTLLFAAVTLAQPSEQSLKPSIWFPQKVKIYQFMRVAARCQIKRIRRDIVH